ncbi:EamA family transporter (plasmid) [Neorhizobium sp. SOG26]|uniref:DMT family transporter n=1 Tax=Neorhizobium sp. SOG26 TaxID=2060726 RepID=UPI000E56D471|nr:EamA family transporter [Neorhizobium sp. SOG26]AXV17743.1 EamA family transporter [Neorhizobium sp. SOG26]
MPQSIHTTKFLILCVVWGLTWIAVKSGIETVPPMMFAATRFACAGALLLLWTLRGRRMVLIKCKDLLRLLVSSLLMITLCYGPLFWGMQFVSSGTAAVLEMSLTPLALLAFGIALREESWSTARALAMGLGALGLSVLFFPAVRLDELSQSRALVGLAAVAWAAVSSAWGSVLMRPLLRRYDSTFLSGSTTLIGGLILGMAALVFEPTAAQSLTVLWDGNAIAAWLFLVIFGSLIGYSLYMQLIRDIGPARAGSFAFVSPAIAVSVGVLVGGEAISFQSIMGMAMMLLAAYICLNGDKAVLTPLTRRGGRNAIRDCDTSG